MKNTKKLSKLSKKQKRDIRKNREYIDPFSLFYFGMPYRNPICNKSTITFDTERGVLSERLKKIK